MEVMNLTPTWEGILPVLLMMLENDTNDIQFDAKQQLYVMARNADKYVELLKQMEAKKK